MRGGRGKEGEGTRIQMRGCRIQGREKGEVKEEGEGRGEK